MKFTTSIITALYLVSCHVNNISAESQVVCYTIYKPVRCGINKQDWFSNDCWAIQGGYSNPNEDCQEVTCDEYDHIVELMEDKFGDENCDQITPRPANPEDAVTWHVCRNENLGATVKLEGIGLQNPYPGKIEIEYDNGGGYSGILLQDDCNDYNRVSDFLVDFGDTIVSCPTVYEPVICGENLVDAWEYPNQCRAEVEGGFTEDQCTCNEPAALMDLMEDKFGVSHCNYSNRNPSDEKGDFYECVSSGVLTATLSVKDYALAIPDTLTLTYEGGAVSTIAFENICNDFLDAEEMLVDYIKDADDEIFCPEVYEPVACGENFAETTFSNQCMANGAGFDETQCTCYELDVLMDLMEEKFGVSNCAYNTDNESSDDYYLYQCGTPGGPTASLYSNEIEMPRTLFFAAEGGSNTDVIIFEQTCSDLTDAEQFLANNGL